MMGRKSPVIGGAITSAAIVGGLFASFWPSGERTTQTNLDTNPSIRPGYEYVDAYTGCVVSSPQLIAIEEGVARIALNINASRNPAAAAATEEGKVRYGTLPRAERTEDPSHTPLVDTITFHEQPPVDDSNTATLRVPMLALADGRESIDVFVTAYNQSASMGVKHYCGTVALIGTTNVDHIQLVENNTVPAREQFLQGK